MAAQALLQLNTRLQGEIQVYDADIKALNDLGKKLIANDITSLNVIIHVVFAHSCLFVDMLLVEIIIIW